MEDVYDIFISYRWDGGFETAKHLNDLLVHDGYTVSFDIDTLREGDFDEKLLKRIDQCPDFILVVDKHAFDRTLDPYFPSKKDWVRKELAYALKLKKNIIPLLLSGVDGFPDNLPEDVADVVTKNGPEYNKYYFDEFYCRLKSFLHCIPRNINNDYRLVDIISDIGNRLGIEESIQRNFCKLIPQTVTTKFLGIEIKREFNGPFSKLISVKILGYNIYNVEIR